MKRRYLWLVRRAYRALRHPRLRHRGWWQALTHALFERHLWMPCRDTVATGLTIGMFFALIPVPMQMIFAGFTAMGILVGTALAAKVSGANLKRAFAVLLVLVAAYILWQSRSTF